MSENYLKKLQEYTEELSIIGDDMGKTFKEKEDLEFELKENELKILGLKKENYQIKGELFKVNKKLLGLERRRKEVEKKKTELK